MLMWKNKDGFFAFHPLLPESSFWIEKKLERESDRERKRRVERESDIGSDIVKFKSCQVSVQWKSATSQTFTRVSGCK